MLDLLLLHLVVDSLHPNMQPEDSASGVLFFIYKKEKKSHTLILAVQVFRAQMFVNESSHFVHIDIHSSA
jgi:hypothetical protein